MWRLKSVKKGPVKEGRRIYSRVVESESEICPGFKDAVGVTPADFLGNLNSFLDDEDSADAEILKKMVVAACARDLEQVVGRDQGFAQQIPRLPRGRSIEYFQQSMPSVRCHHFKGTLLLHGMRM